MHLATSLTLLFETWPDWKAANGSPQSAGDEDIKGLRIKGRVEE